MSEVSVIIPTYNHAHYLPQAIQSVLAQTYPHWELIVVDDGSTDSTAEVVGCFADGRIRCIHQPNQGLASARNTGIHAAQGAYFAFLDADDQWKPQFLQTCVEALGADDRVAGVYCRCYFVDQVGVVLPQIGGAVVADNAFRRRLLEGGFFPPHAALVRAEVVRKVGLFDTHLEGSGTEDWDLWLRTSEGHVMRGLAEPLALYRVYPDSMSTNVARMQANRMAVLTKRFGSPDGNPATWSKDKRRAYAFAHRAAALGYIQQSQPDEGWRFLVQAVSVWPNLLERLDTFYELACGDQPRGYRGLAGLLDIESNGAEMLKRLDSLFAEAGPTLEPMRRRAYGNTYLALGMLSDQAGRWGAARRYLFRAVRANPHLVASFGVARRLLKLCAGQRLAGLVRLMLGSKQRIRQHTVVPYPQG